MGKELSVRSDNELMQDFEKRVGKLLTAETIKNYLCPEATDEELFIFIQLCRGQYLNPFARDVYLVKYKADSPASMVVSKDAYFKRADSFPQYNGLKSGVITITGSKREYREGCMLFPGETLVGGWAEVHRKDRAIPFRSEVSMTEYEGKKYNWKTRAFEVNSMWKSKPATMIAKVAEVQALRKAFPQLMGMYIAEEMDIGGETLPVMPVNPDKIKEPKQKIIDVAPEEAKAVKVKKEKPEVAEPEIPEDTKKEVEKLEPFKKKETAEKAETEKPANAPTDFRQKQIASLIASLPVPEDEKDDFVKILQEKVDISVETTVDKYTQEEAVKMVEILKKQVAEIGQDQQDEPPAEEQQEEKPKAKTTAKKAPAKKKASSGDGNVCSEEGCGKYVSKKVADYSKKNLNGQIFCWDCQQKMKTQDK